MRLVAVLVLALALVGSGPALALQEESDGATETFEYVIRTLPAAPGATFSLDGETRSAGADGVVRFDVPLAEDGAVDPDVFDRLVLETPEFLLDDESRARFVRWRGRTSRSSSVTAQFVFEYRVSFELVDSAGAPVAPDKIDEITLKSSIGEFRTIDPTEDPWLLGTRIVPGRSSLDEKPVFWTVQSAIDDGLEVVNRSETKFFPATDRTIPMRMLYFSARFEVIDAFFGFNTGEALLIESPNGETESVPLVDGVVEFDQLARGEYTVTVDGPGMKLSRPVAISRNQDVDLKLYTWLDLGLVAALLLTFLVVPIWLGVRARKSRPRRGIPTGGSPDVEHPVGTDRARASR